MHSLTIHAPLSCLQIPFPPHAPLAGKEKGSFAEKTITQRLPSIIKMALTDGEALYERYKGDEAALTQVRLEGCHDSASNSHAS